ncbi:MAG: hypothetical protein AAB224_09490 [Gemmatimonadota bacterium]
MNSSLPTHRAGFRALAVVVALGTVVLVARPSAGRTVPPAKVPAEAASVALLHAPIQGGPVIQVRDFPGASIVEVVAWNASEPAFGLRTWVRRSGAADRYHRLWVNSDFGPGGRDVAQAQGLKRPLPVTSATDAQNCLAGKCAPNSTFGARLPDGPFRESKEDVAVKFITGGGSDFTFTLRRGLIDAYLATVDSVVASLKK